MTASHNTRNTNICDEYLIGASVANLCAKYGLGRQRVQQILLRGQVWAPRLKTNRTKFLGIATDAETKDALTAGARREGVSVSAFATRKLKEALDGVE